MRYELKDDAGKVVATVTGANPDANGCDEGVWLELQADDGTRPTLCLVKDKKGGHMHGAWFLGVFRDARNTGSGCDLAITFDKADGPVLQVIKGGKVKHADLFDLLP
jgi:hypothetical protein